MCDCIHAWIPDETVDGSHSSKPVTCNEWKEALEIFVLRTQGHTQDSLDLSDPQRIQELLHAVDQIKSHIDDEKKAEKNPG